MTRSGVPRKPSACKDASEKKNGSSLRGMEPVLKERVAEEKERLRETIDVLSDRRTVRRIKAAMVRLEKGEFLTEDRL